jgi:hypothetical protein
MTNLRRQRFIFLLLMCLPLGVGLTAHNLGDFDYFYYAAQALTHGLNPYTVPGFYSPIYVLLYFAPLSLLPLPVAFQVNAVLSSLVFGWIYWRWAAARPWFWLGLMCLPFLVWSAWHGNIDWMPLLAGVVNPAAGLWLALAKPQMGFVLAVVLAHTLLKRGSWRQALTHISLLGLAYALSINWGLNWTGVPQLSWNFTVWPLGWVVGGMLLLRTWRRRSVSWALAAAPWLSPYLGSPGSWSGWCAPITARWLAPVFVVSWLLVLIRALIK